MLLRLGVIVVVGVRAGTVGGDDGVDCWAVGEAVFAVDVLLCSEVHEEDDGDGSQDDGWAPGVIGPVASHAYTCIGTNFAICWVKKTGYISLFMFWSRMRNQDFKVRKDAVVGAKKG